MAVLQVLDNPEGYRHECLYERHRLRAQRAYNQPRALPFTGLTSYRDIKGRALGWLAY